MIKSLENEKVQTLLKFMHVFKRTLLHKPKNAV